MPTRSPEVSGLLFKEAWDYCHYRHKVLDYLLQTMNNSPHLLDILFPYGYNNPISVSILPLSL